MSTTVKCRGCGTNFKASAGSRCPVCDNPYREPKEPDAKAKPAKKKVAPPERAPTKCPVCQKSLTPGVKFCVGCGTALGTADAGDVFVAGAKMEEQSARDINKYRWQLFFARFFRWW
jgi:predicted amidophosphoribosyltransferase